MFSLTTSLEPIRKLEGHAAGVNVLKIKEELDFFVTGAWDSELRVWNFKDNDSTLLSGHSRGIGCLDFDAYFCISGSWDKSENLDISCLFDERVTSNV